MTDVEIEVVDSVSAFYIMSEDPYEKLVATVTRSVLKDPAYSDLVTSGSVDRFFNTVKEKVENSTRSSVVMLQMCVKQDVGKRAT